MAPLDYKKLAAQELKRTDSAASLSLYLDIPDALVDIPAVIELRATVGILSTKEIKITHSDGYGVAEALRNRIWTSVETIEEFCKRALLAQK